MSTYTFLVSRMLKNYVKQLFAKPAMAILYAVLAVIVIFSMVTMFSIDTQAAQLAVGAPYLSAALLLAFFITLYIALRNALTRGTTVFSLEDVQLMFTAPLSSQSVLLYGVVRSCGASFTILFVLAMQFANLRNLFGMSVASYVVFLIAWFFMSLVSQVIALTLYALLADKPRGKRIALYLTNGSAILMALAAGYVALRNPSFDAISAFFSGGAWDLFPMFGWLRHAVMAAEGAEITQILLGISMTVILGAVVLAVLWRANPDYYEDVLSLSQERFEMKQAASKGKAQAAGLSRRKVRVGKSGIAAGRGANAFFFKHLTEMRREGLFFIDQRTLIYILVVGIMVFTLNSAIGDPKIVLVVAAMTMIYVQMIFSMTMGRFVQEQLKPYVYLVPASARAKVFFANLESAVKAALDGLLCLILAAAITGASPIDAVFAALMVGLCNLLFNGGTLLTEWILKDSHSKLLSALLYFLVEMILLTPGVVLFLVLMFALPQIGILPYLAFSAYAALAVLLLFSLLGGILHNLETTQ